MNRREFLIAGLLAAGTGELLLERSDRERQWTESPGSDGAEGATPPPDFMPLPPLGRAL